MTPYRFARQGRSPYSAAVVVGVWALLMAGWLWLDITGWIIGFVALFTLPAVWDIWRNPESGLELNNTTLRWYAGRRNVRLRLKEIEHIRLDTRLDFSVRATAVLATGRRLRLPFESTPPHQSFENALNARGVRTQRHHFTLMQ